MKNLTFFSKYSSDQRKRESLYPLFEAVFGIPMDVLTDFYARGFWNPTYEPYTLFDGERAVANASMFTMPLNVNGQRTLAAGIQSVMTHPDYRGQGLMKQVVTKMLDEIDERFETAVLMTENPALYTSFGFRTVREHIFTAPVQEVAKASSLARKLEFFDESDLRIVQECFANQHPLSHRFAPVSYESSFCLNMYSPYYQEKLYYAEDLNSLLIYDVDGDTLRLYDVIGGPLPTVEQIVSQVAEPVRRAVFYFAPDALGVQSYEAVPYESGSYLMVRGKFDVKELAFKLPITASF